MNIQIGDMLRYTTKIGSHGSDYFGSDCNKEYYCVVIDNDGYSGYVFWITSPSNNSFHQTVSWNDTYGIFDKVAK